MKYNLSGKRVWVAGHKGMAGSAIVRRLEREECEILTVERECVDLRRQDEVEDWMALFKPQVIFMAAAKVGGIHANAAYPADFLYGNLMIQTNIIQTAHKMRVEKLLFLGSSCIYPRLTEQPIKEEALLSGALEPTNEGYAMAKIAGIKLCQMLHRQHGCNFISVMPTNLYGPGDNFHSENSHVAAALLRRFYEAKQRGAQETAVWGTGSPRREFLYVDDLADACVFLMKHYAHDCPINIGTGQDISIKQWAEKIKQRVGFKGRLIFDTSRPDGTPRKVLDVSRLTALGWTAPTSLEEGLDKYVGWFLRHVPHVRGFGEVVETPEVMVTPEKRKAMR